MNYQDLPQFEDFIDRLDFATLAELIAAATDLDQAADHAVERGSRAILLTLSDLLNICADHRNRDLDAELQTIIDAGSPS